MCPKADAPIKTASDVTNRPYVVDIVEAQQALNDILTNQWKLGLESLSIGGFPGMGKTTKIGIYCIDKLRVRAPGFESGIVVMALPTRALVHEKVKSFQAKLRPNDTVSVIEALGRIDERGETWWCENSKEYLQKFALRRSGCSQCQFLKKCRNEPGRFLHSLSLVNKKIKTCADSSTESVLIVTTFDMLAGLLKRLPPNAIVILDDAGATFRMLQTTRIRRQDLDCQLGTMEEARGAELVNLGIGVSQLPEHYQRWKERETQTPTGAPLPLVFVLDLCISTIRSIQTFHSKDTKRARPSSILQYHKSLLTNPIGAPPCKDSRPQWPWEKIDDADGLDYRPAFTDLLLQIARETALGFPPVFERSGRLERARGNPDLSVYLPDLDLIERARRGFVVWLGVAPMPKAIAASLNVRDVYISARPKNMEIVAVLLKKSGRKMKVVRYESFGAGRYTTKGETDTTEIVRRCVTQLAERDRIGPVIYGQREYRGFGAILHKRDFDELGHRNYIGYYNRDHASTDRFEDRQILLVRRWIQPYDSISKTATALRRALRLPDAKSTGKKINIVTKWEGSELEINTRSFEDAFEREVLQYFEMHAQLNAVGRCRPLTHTEDGRLILLFAGRPFPGIAPKLVDLETLCAELRIDPQLEDFGERDRLQHERLVSRSVDAEKRQRDIEKELTLNPQSSAAHLASLCQTSVRTIRRDLGELHAQKRLPTLLDTRPIVYLISQMSTSVGAVLLPTATELAGFVSLEAGKGINERTILRFLADVRVFASNSNGVPIEWQVPNRSDQRRHLERLTAALARWWKSRESK